MKGREERGAKRAIIIDKIVGLYLAGAANWTILWSYFSSPSITSLTPGDLTSRMTLISRADKQINQTFDNLIQFFLWPILGIEIRFVHISSNN